MWKLIETADEESRQLQWDTYCKKNFPYLDGAPVQFGWEYCPYCGGHLAVDARLAEEHNQQPDEQKEKPMIDTIEQEIQAKGLTAPRVTPQHIEDVIQAEYYFTARDGVAGSTPRGEGFPGHEALQLLTFCVLVLDNGFTVTGESACVSPDNFDAEVGRKVARENAKAKIWPLEGYLLKQSLYEQPN